MNLDLGILLALACAFVANLGFFYKYRGANSVPKVQVMHPFRSARSLYSSKWFALGMLIAGAASGLLFGVSDTAIKALTGITGAHGISGLILSPWLMVAVAASIVAFYASARGLQDGDAVPVTAVAGRAANIAGIAGGIV